MAQQLGALALLLGLAGTSLGLDFFHSNMELSYLVTGGALGVVYLGLTGNMGQLLLLNLTGKCCIAQQAFQGHLGPVPPSNKPCHYCSHPPSQEFLKCFSCGTIRSYPQTGPPLVKESPSKYSWKALWTLKFQHYPGSMLCTIRFRRNSFHSRASQKAQKGQ